MMDKTRKIRNLSQTSLFYASTPPLERSLTPNQYERKRNMQKQIANYNQNILEKETEYRDLLREIDSLLPRPRGGHRAPLGKIAESLSLVSDERREMLMEQQRRQFH